MASLKSAVVWLLVLQAWEASACRVRSESPAIRYEKAESVYMGTVDERTDHCADESSQLTEAEQSKLCINLNHHYGWKITTTGTLKGSPKTALILDTKMMNCGVNNPEEGDEVVVFRSSDYAFITRLSAEVYDELKQARLLRQGSTRY